jgi:hypothetical protein
MHLLATFARQFGVVAQRQTGPSLTVLKDASQSSDVRGDTALIHLTRRAVFEHEVADLFAGSH